MLDFVDVQYVMRYSGKEICLIPKFKIDTKVKDVMTRGSSFYAIWDFENECWSTNIDRAYELIDACVNEYMAKEIKKTGNEHAFQGVRIFYATDSDSGIADKFINYTKKQKGQNYHPLDTRVVFKNDKSEKELYSSHRLPYDPVEGETPAYDKLMSVLYSEEERQKIEWLVGACLAGDNGKIQKFGVFYGDPGTGKGTVMDIIKQLFSGYTASFDADALGRKSDRFALEPFKNHPVIAIQADGNLSRVEDNTRLNSLVSHETLNVDEKFKGKYDTNFDTVLFIGTNNPVKITDAKSGLLRRLIDIEPTGNTIEPDEYDTIMQAIPFEIGAIAYHCREFYLNNKRLYNSYRPMTMMFYTNEFYDFVLEYFDQFCSEDYILLSTAWTWYKKYVEDANSYSKMSRNKFATELASYFDDPQHDEWFVDEEGNRRHLSSVYRGFKKDKFKNVRDRKLKVNKKSSDKPEYEDVANKGHESSANESVKSAHPSWLDLKEPTDVDSNPFNVYFESAQAQYAVSTGSPNSKDTRPKKAWSNSKVKLNAINTKEEHYVLTQTVEPKLVVIDFDCRDEKTGEKSLEKSLEAAKLFPKTYAETSRSGNGLHLHYIYDGDIDDLSMLFDTGIEIKVFKGLAPLRRKLIFCNEEKIAHISSGLPLKEVKKKMIDKNVINDEKHLRNCIVKALKKQVHPNTKPNIDYIKMILDRAYESGMHYDVNDLRPKIMNFAAISTNNSEYCMGVAVDLHYCSDDVTENKETKVYLDKPIAFFDWEVFPNLSILCYKPEGGTVGMDGKKEVIRLVNPSPNDVSRFFESYRAIGFNNIKYDNHISYARILGYSNEELFKLSCDLIRKDGPKNPGFRESKNLSYTDIYDFSNTKQSLKKWEIELDLHHQEFPLPFTEPVPEDMWDLAADYCCNDVVATEVVFYHLEEDWNARQVLAKISGLTVNDSTNAHSAKFIFGSNRNPQTEFVYKDLSEEFPGYEFNRYGIDKTRYNTGADGKPVCTSGKSIFMGDDPSEGGYVYFETGIWRNVVLLDIASLHPSTIENLNLFGPYTVRFSEIKAARVAIKHKEWQTARGYLDGALAPFLEGVENLSDTDQQYISDSLSYALKIVINSVYGCTSASFPNPFKDPRNVDNVVAKRGALFMILLKHEVQKLGYTVAHIKTDSIKIPNGDDRIIKFVMDFGKKYGYSFEHEATYEKMLLVNKSVYIAKYDDFGERTKGGRHANCWTATGAEFQHPYIFKELFSKEPIKFKDYCETKSVSGEASMYLDYNEELVSDLEEELYSLKEELEHATIGKLSIRKQIKAKQEEIDSIHNMSFVGKCGSFVPVVRGSGGGYLMRVDGKTVGSVNGAKGYRWLESETVLSKNMESRLDMNYYRNLIDNAINHISEFGDPDEFING